MEKFLQKYIDVSTVEGTILYSLAVLLICWGVSWILGFILGKFLYYRQNRALRGVTQIKFFKNALRLMLFLLGLFIIILTVPGLREKAAYIFSGAGILAAVIAFAAQAAVANIIAGIFIVIFKPFRVGDYIKLDEERLGIVEDINLRQTVIRTFENKLLIIPNSVISNESVLNHNIRNSKILSFNNFKIGLFADIDKIRGIIQEEARKLPLYFDNRTNYEKENELLSDVEVRVIDVFDTYIHIRAYVWISDPFMEFKMKCDLKEAVQKRFIAEGVEMPIPLRKIIQ
ncbi:mechanosensitive ion channel family protein [Aquimarina sp. 2-A2]|uniref:mechanosensitive ion channel family protein n=1 Tax=Aquimarina sp. 2-A2 TaxID=3382644 RepID=UPI00387F22E7